MTSTARLHHTQVKFFNHLGVTPVVQDDGISIQFGARSLSAKSAKALIEDIRKGGQSLIDEIAAGQVSQRARSGMVVASYKRLYDEFNGNCGDDLAVALREATWTTDVESGASYCDVKKVRAVARENGIEAKGKNPGHMLMNLSNRLRARLRKDERVVVGGEEVLAKRVNSAKCWGDRAK